MAASLQEAYEAWVATFPKDAKEGSRTHFHSLRNSIIPIPKNWDGDCDCVDGSRNHHQEKAMTKLDARGNPYTYYQLAPTPDEFVCKRERAWREYCRVRDGQNQEMVS